MLTRQAQRLCCFPCPCPYLFFPVGCMLNHKISQKSMFQNPKAASHHFHDAMIDFFRHPILTDIDTDTTACSILTRNICWCASQTELMVLSYFRLPIWGLVRKSVATWNCMMTHKLPKSSPAVASQERCFRHSTYYRFVGGFVVLAPLRNYVVCGQFCVLENDVHAHGANCINCPLSFDLLFCVWFCL